jgi:hypothetical protein
MWQVWERGETHTGFWRGNIKEKDLLGDLGVDGRIMLKFIFEKWDGRAETGFIRPRIWTGSGL